MKSLDTWRYNKCSVITYYIMYKYKILEKLVHKRLYSFCDSNKILYDNQYGFRLKHSTVDAVSKFTADIVSLEK